MLDWNKVIPIVVVGVVTAVSFLVLPLSSGIQEKLVYGLLSLCGLYGVGAGIKFTIDKIAGKREEK
jgi:hypothetical protein